MNMLDVQLPSGSPDPLRRGSHQLRSPQADAVFHLLTASSLADLPTGNVGYFDRPWCVYEDGSLGVDLRPYQERASRSSRGEAALIELLTAMVLGHGMVDMGVGFAVWDGRDRQAVAHAMALLLNTELVPQ